MKWVLIAAVISGAIVSAYHYWYEVRTLDLAQTAHLACLMHRRVQDCHHLIPSKLHPATFQYCRLRFTHAECAEYNPTLVLHSQSVVHSFTTPAGRLK